MKKIFLSLTSAAASLGMVFSAYAQPVYEGMAKPWQLGFQPAATPVMERLTAMHDILLWVITMITVVVLLIMAVICLKFNRKANPVPSKTTHNTLLEIVWTVIPIFILIAIAIPSLRIHYFMQKIVEPEMTLKVVGYQWYWHYEYPDQGGFGYDSYLKKDGLKPDEHRLLAVDNRVVVPVNTKIRVLMTGADVIHSWAVPAFGVKRDAIPGRLNESWFEATKIGTFYGQCSELCGVGHGFMPIVVDVVGKDDFNRWVAQKQKEVGIAPAAQGKAAPAAGQNPTTPAQKTAPLAKSNPPAKTPDAQINEEKAHSKATGAGKPSVPAATVTPPVNNNTDDKDADDKE